MQNSRFSSLSAKLTVVICGLVLTGCGGKPATVTGVVTLDGQPLQRGMIGFAPVSGGMKAAGIIEPDGNYSLKNEQRDGAQHWRLLGNRFVARAKHTRS